VRVGAVFPQTEIGPDPAAVRAYAEGVQELGFVHLMAYDHVLGADRETHTHLTGPYRAEDQFHEILVLFGYLATIVTGMELVTGVVIAPQRQTALLAKQAAEIDLLTGGRLRFGLGIGWNDVEYEALGMDFSNRGRRFEEQIELMRKLCKPGEVARRGGGVARPGRDAPHALHDRRGPRRPGRPPRAPSPGPRRARRAVTVTAGRRPSGSRPGDRRAARRHRRGRPRA